MENKTVITRFGLSIFDISILLTIVFVILKLCGVIAWSWWWVVSPIVFAIGLFILSVIILFILGWILSKGDDN